MPGQDIFASFSDIIFEQSKRMEQEPEQGEGGGSWISNTSERPGLLLGHVDSELYIQQEPEQEKLSLRVKLKEQEQDESLY